MTQPHISEQQREVNSIIHQARMNAFFWVGGVGSLRAVLGARKALNLIQKSEGTLEGKHHAKFAELIGMIGVLVWVPFIVIGIIISLITK
jgi:putative NADH-flavin reductase